MPGRPKNDPAAQLSHSLEDYLETIYDLVRDNKVARVKEIARLRDVKPGSVSPAMKRLAEMGLINYGQREYIDLTPSGERAARRVAARHRLLRRFFLDILNMDPETAESDACAIEHSLSNEAMDRLVRLFEFIKTCPEDDGKFLERFHTCAMINPGAEACESCPNRDRLGTKARQKEIESSVADLQPGEHAVVTQVNASGAIRQRLLDMGILPDATIRLERVAPSGDPVWVRLHGFQLSLRRAEAESVLVQTNGK